MTKPFVYAPAMNTDMWNHPITAKQLRVLDEFGYKMIPPVEKKLACGVVGTSADTVRALFTVIADLLLLLCCVCQATEVLQRSTLSSPSRSSSCVRYLSSTKTKGYRSF
jgi:hypothetical protein